MLFFRTDLEDKNLDFIWSIVSSKNANITNIQCVNCYCVCTHSLCDKH